MTSVQGMNGSVLAQDDPALEIAQAGQISTHHSLLAHLVEAAIGIAYLCDGDGRRHAGLDAAIMQGSTEPKLRCAGVAVLAAARTAADWTTCQ